MAAKTILVIDDSDDLRALSRNALEKAGFTVEDTGDANAALGKISSKKLKPDLILLDAIMPGMDGWAFMKALQADRDGAKIPIILCSSMVDLERSKLPDGVIVAAKMEKPFTGAQLSNLVKQVLETDLSSRF